jgi:hypothetical protein
MPTGLLGAQHRVAQAQRLLWRMVAVSEARFERCGVQGLELLLLPSSLRVRSSSS